MSSLLMAAADAAHPLVTLAGDVPNPADNVKPIPGGAAQDMVTILGWAFWVVTILGVLGILTVAGGMVISHRRGDASEHGGKLGIVLGALILASASGPIVNAIL
ncbi:hypothetical protein ACFVEN_44135 [Streptomyces sp. NPDC057681]|uniref:hypothetical protein n=1 Tax=Streptomyces sp. NPDC057681 TaxID=3346209 RepID=UPI0036B53B89